MATNHALLIANSKELLLSSEQRRLLVILRVSHRNVRELALPQWSVLWCLIIRLVVGLVHVRVPGRLVLSLQVLPVRLKLGRVARALDVLVLSKGTDRRRIRLQGVVGRYRAHSRLSGSLIMKQLGLSVGPERLRS